MWRDDPHGAIAEFCARVERGDTEFPVDLCQSVAGFLNRVRDEPKAKETAPKKAPVAEGAPVKKTTAKKTTAKK